MRRQTEAAEKREKTAGKIWSRILSAVLSGLLFSACMNTTVPTPSPSPAQESTPVSSPLPKPQETAAPAAVQTGDLSIFMNSVFHHCEIVISQADFETLGFRLGDSVNVYFKSGKTFLDVPYYSGYYVPPDEIVLCAYPNFKNLNIAYNCGREFWYAENLDESDTVRIELNEAGKYRMIEDIFSQTHSDDPNDYETIEDFCNFRALSGGEIAENRIFRSSSPVNNKFHRAAYNDDLLEKYGIRTVLDLADSREDFDYHRGKSDWNSDYCETLIENGNFIFLNLGVALLTDSFAETLSRGLYDMCSKEGPYFFNCSEGKDRTGFAAIIIEGLCGATYEELKDDYMRTFEVYYGITEEKDKQRYDAVVNTAFDPLLKVLLRLEEDTDLKTVDYRESAERFLKRGGLSDAEIQTIRDALTK